MDFVVRQDMSQLAFDSNNLQMIIGELIQDCEVWARDRENCDLMEFAENLKRLEFDVVELQADWVTRMGKTYHENSEYDMDDGFQKAFVSLDILFNDLKKMRAELNESYIHHSEIKALEIDWARFKKMTSNIRQSFREADAYVKKGAASYSHNGGGDVGLSAEH